MSIRRQTELPDSRTGTSRPSHRTPHGCGDGRHPAESRGARAVGWAAGQWRLRGHARRRRTQSPHAELEQLQLLRFPAQHSGRHPDVFVAGSSKHRTWVQADSDAEPRRFGRKRNRKLPDATALHLGRERVADALFWGQRSRRQHGADKRVRADPRGDADTFTNSVTSNPIAWTSLNSPFAVTTGSGSLKIANLGGQPNVYYHTANGNPESQGVILRSTLVGQTGTPGSNWVPLRLLWHHHRHGVDVDPTNGNRVIISGINAATNNFADHLTPDFGGNWVRLQNLENLMLGINPLGGQTFLNRVALGRNTGTLNFGSYWQPSLFKFNPLDPTVTGGAVDAGVFLSLDNGANWRLISSPTNPTSNSPHIPLLHAYFSPGRFAALTSAFDVWVDRGGRGVTKVVIELTP